MLSIILPILFQAVTVIDPSAAIAPQEQPKEICQLKPMTGSRVKKVKVCKSTDAEKRAQDEQDAFRRYLQKAGDSQPVLPPGAGG